MERKVKEVAAHTQLPAVHRFHFQVGSGVADACAWTYALSLISITILENT